MGKVHIGQSEIRIGNGETCKNEDQGAERRWYGSHCHRERAGGNKLEL